MVGTSRISLLCRMFETDSKDGETKQHLQHIVLQMHQMLELINPCLDEIA